MANQLFAIFLIFLSAYSASASKDEKKLFTKLFENYDTRVRPVENPNDTLTVEVGVLIRKLVRLNPTTDTFEANTWVFQQWNDYQLKWDPEEFGGITKLQAAQKDIFKTDLVLYNSAQEMFKEQRQQPNKAIITSDGKVMVVDSIRFAADCPINETAKEITCTVILGSWVYGTSQINLTVGLFDTDSEVLATPMWTLKDIKGKRMDRLYPIWGENYSSIYVDFTLTKNENPEDVN